MCVYYPLNTQSANDVQVEELLNGARVDYVREDDIDEAIKALSGLFGSLPKRLINSPKGEAAKYLERMGMSQVVLPSYIMQMSLSVCGCYNSSNHLT